MIVVGELRHLASAQVKNVQFIIPKTADANKIAKIEELQEGRKEEDHQYKKYTVPIGSQTFQLLSGCNIDRIGIKDDVTFEVLLDEYLVDFN